MYKRQIQASRFTPGEIVFCNETGGDAHQRMWFCTADGTVFKPLYKETPLDWVCLLYTSVSGTVLDKTGESVIGASVVVKGTTNGTITDFDGKFTLQNVPDNGTCLLYTSCFSV